MEFNRNGTVSEHFFENLFLSDFTPSFSNELGVEDLGLWLAVLVVSARLPLGHALVWGALVRHHVASLHEVGVHVGPAAFAAFVHEIALHHLLGGEDWDLLAVFQFKSSFNGLHESDGIARSALALVAYWTREVIAVDVSEIIGIWDLIAWNILRSGVLFSPFLCFVQRRFE